MRKARAGLVTTTAVWGLAILIPALLISRADPAETFDLLRSADFRWLIPASAAVLLSEMLFGSIRYRILLAAMGWSLPFKEILFLRMGMMPIRQVAPFKSGEAVRVLWLYRRHGVRVSGSVVTFLMNLGAQVFALSAIASIGLIMVKPLAGAAVLAGVIIATTVMIHLPDTLRVAARILPQKARTAVIEFAGRLGRREFRHAVLKTLALSVVCSALDLTASFFVLSSFGFRFPGWPFFPVMAAVSLAGAISITPFGLGMREGVLAVLASGWLDAATTGIGGLTMTLVLRVLPAIVGLPWLLPFLKILVETDSGRTAAETSGGRDTAPVTTRPDMAAQSGNTGVPADGNRPEHDI